MLSFFKLARVLILCHHLNYSIFENIVGKMCYLLITTLFIMLLLFFFIIDLYFLISAVNAQIFISTAKLVIPTGTQTNEANAKIKTQAVTFETKIGRSST